MSPLRLHDEDRQLHLSLAVRQPDVIDAILTHCGLPDEPPRAPPHAAAPAIRELQYVSDLQFVDDPAPPEPVWSES